MKGIKRLGVTFFAALLIAACTEKDGTEVNSVVPLNFSTSVDGAQTRGSEFNSGNLKSMGVFACFTNGDFTTEATPNYLYNEAATKSETRSDWTYTNTRYWPNNTTDRISFFAYAPHSATGVACSDETTKGYPALTYTVPTTEAAQTDLLAAVPLMNLGRSTVDNSVPATVSFTLKHALTKVGIYVKSNDDIVGKKITAFSITSTKSGTLTWHAPADDNDVGFGWSSLTDTETFTPAAITSTIAFAVPDKSTADKVPLATFFLLPNTEGGKFSITYTYTGMVGTEEITQPISLTDQALPSPENWVQGASVTYTIGIEKKKITITTEPAWIDGGTGTTTGYITTTYVVSPSSIGWQEGSAGTADGTEQSD